jgi:hypothetical protein
MVDWVSLRGLSMIVGFTGTRNGMTETQKAAVAQLLSELSPSHVIHGDCVGADAGFHVLALEQRIPIIIYPGCVLGDPRRAGCQRAYSVHKPKAFLQRNHDIVDSCEVLIATPAEYAEALRSGTWATVRYARKQGKSIRIVWPDGSVKDE